MTSRSHASDTCRVCCLACLGRYRADHVARVLEEERGELTALDQEVLRTLREHELVSADPDAAFEQRWTLGERVADRVAAFGGSWRFIAIVGGLLAAWVTLNSLAALWRPFDPYPYILLNLLLSCLAAIQAPDGLSRRARPRRAGRRARPASGACG